MESDYKHIRQLVDRINEHEKQQIDQAARSLEDRVCAIEHSISHEGLLATSVKNLHHLLERGYKAERAQSLTALDVILPWRKQKARQRISDRIVMRGYQSRFTEPLSEKYPALGMQPRQFEHVNLEGNNTYLLELEDTKSVMPEGTFVHGWRFTSCYIPYSDYWTGKSLREGYGKDLTIERFTRAVGHEFQESDKRFHIRHNVKGEMVTFWAFRKGERLDEYQIVGLECVQMAHGLVNQALDQLNQHLSTKRT